MADTVVVEKDMALAHRDFFRLAPKAFPDGNYDLKPAGLVREDGDGRHLEITMGPEGERRIALLSITTTPVTLVFTGYTDDDRTQTLVEFDRAFQKGGG